MAYAYGLTNKGFHREFNEDYMDVFEYEGLLFLFVADGQGSHQGGLSASSLAIHEIKTYLQTHFQQGRESQLESILKEALYLAHRVIGGAREANDEYQGLCTSITIVVLQPNRRITIAHVGNTKFFLLRRGNLIRMTKDHTVAQQLVDERKITPEEYSLHPQRAALTRCIGILPRDQPQPDIASGEVLQGDILLLTSDGITEHLQEAEIRQIVEQAGNTKTACEYLIQGANERGGYDNLTAVTAYINS